MTNARAVGLVLLLLLAVACLAAPASAQTTAPRVTINTDAAEFTVLAGQATKNLRVMHFDVQNVGAAAVTLLLCDGTCGTAANIKFDVYIPAKGGYTFSPAQETWEWLLSTGASIIGRVDTGATNNVKVFGLIYRVYPF